MEQQLTCGFIGLGLIGGSIARAIREYHPAYTLIAYDLNPQATALAAEDGVIDAAVSAIGTEFSSCDIVFLCAPVSCNDANLLALKEHLSKDCILTDVGSVKTDIHQHIKEIGLEDQFIGGHPMAGSERIGYQNSKALLLENAYYILTPCDSVPAEKVALFKDLVQSLGAIPLQLTYKEHDYVTAAISHLPHVIAASLVNLVKDSDSAEGIMKMIAAGGFKDITRIASSSPVMWQQICLTNGSNISALLSAYITSLEDIQTKIDTECSDALYRFFDEARTYRDSFIDAGSGPIKKTHFIKVDIADEPGAIATVATILALNQINIKNIGIRHNREQESGALSVEFYDQSSLDRAVAILRGKNYTIY